MKLLLRHRWSRWSNELEPDSVKRVKLLSASRAVTRRMVWALLALADASAAVTKSTAAANVKATSRLMAPAKQPGRALAIGGNPSDLARPALRALDPADDPPAHRHRVRLHTALGEPLPP